MKNLSIFKQQIAKHYAYKKQNVLCLNSSIRADKLLRIERAREFLTKFLRRGLLKSKYVMFSLTSYNVSHRK